MTRDDLARCLAAAIIGLSLGVIACVAWAAHQPQELRVDGPVAVTPASEDARNVPWRLVMPCPIDRRNVPQYRERNT